MRDVIEDINKRMSVGDQPSIREILDVIDTRLSTGDEDSKTLWMILSSLRGPDNDDEHLKNTYTCPIRTAAFPLTSKLGAETTGAFFAPEWKTTVEELAAAIHRIRKGMSGKWAHFAHHAERGLYGVFALRCRELGKEPEEELLKTWC